MLQASTVMQSGMKRPDYFGSESFLILNQNQILFTIIQHRATFFLNYTNQWIGLLNKDISNLRRYVDFNSPVSYNAKMKALHTYVVIEAFDKKTSIQRLDWLRPFNVIGSGTSYPIGELILRHPDKESLKSVMSDVKMHPGSESMLESGSKIVIFNGNSLFKTPGYFYNQRNDEPPYVGTVFPLKQNIPSRLKTHVLGDCFEVLNPVKKPIFDQDYIEVDGVVQAKDNGLIGAVIVFDDMELDTGRLMFGEIELMRKCSPCSYNCILFALYCIHASNELNRKQAAISHFKVSKRFLGFCKTLDAKWVNNTSITCLDIGVSNNLCGLINIVTHN